SVAWSVLCNVESELLNRWLEPLDFRLWDARTGTIVGTLEAKSSVTSAEFDPPTREVHIHLATVGPEEPHAATLSFPPPPEIAQRTAEKWAPLFHLANKVPPN
ncbi:eukaryotic translation initiation factor 3subunit I, partial [Striga asiatica]